MITVISYPIAGGLIISHLGNLSVSWKESLLQTKAIDLFRLPMESITRPSQFLLLDLEI